MFCGMTGFRICFFNSMWKETLSNPKALQNMKYCHLGKLQAANRLTYDYHSAFKWESSYAHVFCTLFGFLDPMPHFSETKTGQSRASTRRFTNDQLTTKRRSEERLAPWSSEKGAGLLRKLRAWQVYHKKKHKKISWIQTWHPWHFLKVSVPF